MAEMTCPEDSSVREILNTIDVQHITEAPAASSASGVALASDDTPYNVTEIDEEIYAECCLAKKCLCKTCYIPDCHGEDEVVVELQPESVNKPGQCCGEYECQRTPNCKAEGDSQLYWLKGCQRCHCFSGKPMCIQICDEAANKTKAICKPEKLNVFFEHGESWRVGCYECECVDGVEKCVLPFCSNINCPRERQVILKDGCCPICWPDCAPMPNELLENNKYANEKYGSAARRYDEDVDEEEEEGEGEKHADHNGNNAPHSIDYSAENEIDTLPDIPLEEDDELEAEKLFSSANAKAEVGQTSTTTVTATTLQTGSSSSTTVPQSSSSSITPPHTTVSPLGHSISSSPSTQTEYLPLSPTTAAPQTHAAMASVPAIATACPPPAAAVVATASRHDAPDSFQLYPEDLMPEVHVVTESCKHWLIYIVIGILVALIAVLIAWIIQLRLKQRSYRPVSHIDDNFNKMACNIKATNNYV